MHNPPPQNTSPTRSALLEAACTLFYQQGIRATSIDAILEKAGVARQSLYLHFRSKDGLIAEFLNLRDQRWRHWLQRHLDQAPPKPEAKLLALFDFLAAWFADADFHGCAFINVAAEYTDPQHPFRTLAARHKELVLDDIRALCAQLPITTADQLALQLALLMEGAIVTEQVTPGNHAAQSAKQIAAILLTHHTQEETSHVPVH
jgi:AcrR family transcriptional regulator